MRFLLRKDMFDPCADFGFDAIGGAQRLRSWLAPGFLAMDAFSTRPCLVSQASLLFER